MEGKTFKHDENGRFTKGTAGGGRKKVPKEIRNMLEGATPEAVRLLVKTVVNTEAPLKLRIDCANTILDRVYGKATQPIDGGMDNTLRVIMSDAVKECAM